MNRIETIDFIKNLIEEAISEAEENGTDNDNFIPSCNEALEFIETIK